MGSAPDDVEAQEDSDPEDFEFIEAFVVPLSKLWRECRGLESQGYL